ncbi:hypothetical protein KP509_01G075500 [Ceratopteris richardii]|uniref:Dirigent protein n=1 Tax=Ceratopteris richardii TaxID=49495 RepID=A0A8T2VHH5_CERRI|nr:hypothetical protein KP509_01G075500 [Ceratopteris richardii]
MASTITITARPLTDTITITHAHQERHVNGAFSAKIFARRLSCGNGSAEASLCRSLCDRISLPRSGWHSQRSSSFTCSNELGMVPAARAPVQGTNTGFGQEVVYEFTVTAGKSPQSKVLGYVRGTAIVVNNTAASTTFFVQNVIHHDNANVRWTLSQQGEAIFSSVAWEYAITGGTGVFRNAYGFNVGRFISSTPTPNGNLITTHYEASVFLDR